MGYSPWGPKSQTGLRTKQLSSTLLPFNTMNVPEFVTRGRNLSAHKWQSLNTPTWSPDLALHGAQCPEVDVTAGASSQGTDSEPRPPGLLLGVMLHVEPSTQNWRVKG